LGHFEELLGQFEDEDDYGIFAFIFSILALALSVAFLKLSHLEPAVTGAIVSFVSFKEHQRMFVFSKTCLTPFLFVSEPFIRVSDEVSPS